ncbi:MAG: rRNA maturation RNase YbeY [Alphaproteobacteria bacterium]|nr:rRNA maturation RNase YbeY [Alphaproteobacteria bacterium]
MTLQCINIDISTKCDNWPNVNSLIHKIIEELFEQYPQENEEIELSIVLADNAFIQDLNKNWRDKDNPTNVLSFPQEHPFILGDVILALETIQKEASEQKKSFNEHLTHLIIHGILHLLGHDHETKKEAKNMEALEIKILTAFNIKNPYADQ